MFPSDVPQARPPSQLDVPQTASAAGRERYERIAKRRGKQTSPRSPSRAKSSPSATTACATERSVAWHPAPRRARSDRRRSAHDPPRRSCAARAGRSDSSSELGCCQWPPLAYPGKPTAAHLIEPSSVARHNRPVQRARTDDSDAHRPRPARHHPPGAPPPQCPNRTLTRPAPAWMDDKPRATHRVSGRAFDLPVTGLPEGETTYQVAPNRREALAVYGAGRVVAHIQVELGGRCKVTCGAPSERLMVPISEAFHVAASWLVGCPDRRPVSGRTHRNTCSWGRASFLNR